MTRRFSILDLRAKEQTEAREAYFADLKRKFGDLQANVRFPLQTLNARPSRRGSARLGHLRFPFKPKTLDTGHWERLRAHPTLVTRGRMMDRKKLLG